MKKICIIHSSMELGGAETSLLGLLQNIDFSHYQVDLMLLNATGALIDLIPNEVEILQMPLSYRDLFLPVKEIIKRGNIPIAVARMLGKIKGKKYQSVTYMTKQYSHWYALPFLPTFSKRYDLAISFIDPHYIVWKKINASIKLLWLHTDFSRVQINEKRDFKMWSHGDYVVNVSQSCKEKFDQRYPALIERSIVIENILSKSFLERQAKAFSVDLEMPENKEIRLLSIGRFSEQKNFDNIPDICRRLCEDGLDVKWYLIGYGADETLIRQKIAEAGMSERVVILGKKENPYPYIKACDVYVQPSRYEGKCVAVREAQILCKPVIITNYSTADSQLTDGFDGVVVPMDNKGCAAGIAAVLRDEALLARLRENTSKSDYTNSSEVEKLYALMGSQQ